MSAAAHAAMFGVAAGMNGDGNAHKQEQRSARLAAW
eukprot:CAMPEP_0169466978 /NCGR_PEP_ID=MMETSP1042-20121227/22075_1 /TAXON_ID=464988 /ORGANISM="Hemiselmis andersenii, Strain CCMP1180" /LENGTH=35 /DNA_ID= /DNA_START= /DNA_END= /DNA_ORIENTATION=